MSALTTHTSNQFREKRNKEKETTEKLKTSDQKPNKSQRKISVPYGKGNGSTQPR
jgi:hypothetical protein